MNARDELMELAYRSMYPVAADVARIQPLAERAGWEIEMHERAADAILAAGYEKVPVAAIQEQVNHMYAAAKQGENMFGENTASEHLRHFADKIGALLLSEGDAA